MKLLLSILGFFIPTAHAQDGNFAADGPGVGQMWEMICSTLPFCNVGTQAPQLAADRGAAILMPLIVGAAVCAGIYAGIQIMMAQGSGDGIDKAKTTVKHAVVGVVLMLITLSLFRFAITVVKWFS